MKRRSFLAALAAAIVARKLPTPQRSVVAFDFSDPNVRDYTTITDLNAVMKRVYGGPMISAYDPKALEKFKLRGS